MAAEVITIFAVVAGIMWLGLMVVAAFRNRGGEEIAANLQPGIDDQQLETRRLERGQKAAIAFSAFLAVSLPIYFLGEPGRQQGFVEEFDQASINRGERIVQEFACFDCHGPLGVGGTASAVEQRSGVGVDWFGPALDDIFYRYNDDEVNFWITFGRGNTPMPPWGTAGGGPMNEHQVVDVVNYLRTIQISQEEAVARANSQANTELDRLAGSDNAVAAAVVRQEQVVAEIDQAAEDYAFIGPLAEEARQVYDQAHVGQDTDGDGLSDVAEVRLSEISAEAVSYFRAFEPVRLDPEEPDTELLDEALAALRSAAERDPILRNYVTMIEDVIENDEGEEDTDGDGVSDAAENQINALLAEANEAVVPAGLVVVNLDPSNPASVGGQSDRATASTLVGALESAALIKRVLIENEDRIRPQEEAGLVFLVEAQENRTWEINVPGVAAAMGVSEEEATRAVGIYQANCARCHTAGFPAGMAFTQEAGSGGFGPALSDGRPTVQFGAAPDDPEFPDPLVNFLLNGSEAESPYGLNGFGTGRMPGFGQILSESDIDLLARYLRTDDLTGGN